MLWEKKKEKETKRGAEEVGEKRKGKEYERGEGVGGEGKKGKNNVDRARWNPTT